MSSRWDYLYDLRPVSLTAHLIAELARIVAERITAWPPPIDGWASERERARFEPLVAMGAPRPDEAVFREAFRLARWELGREVEAVDDYMRHERWRELAGPDTLDAIIFLWRYLTEELLTAQEATEGRVRRHELITCLDDIERRVFTGRVITF